MRVETQTIPPSKKAVLAGWLIGGLPSLLMLATGIAGLINPAPMLDGFKAFGYPEQLFRILVAVEVVCVVIYLIPKTAILGAILMTGYFGGATATHVRMSDPLFVVPFLFGVIFWLGLFLREPRLRALIPVRK